MSVLTFVAWYCKEAVYLGDRFIYFGEPTVHWGVLRALGYECRRLEEIPTHDIPMEFDRDANGWWKPPESLATLARQQQEYKQRRRHENIALLRRELAELEGLCE